MKEISKMTELSKTMLDNLWEKLMEESFKDSGDVDKKTWEMVTKLCKKSFEIGVTVGVHLK
jgi:hypothetical protein